VHEDSLGADLLTYIIEQKCSNQPCKWRMNDEWWAECRKLTVGDGYPLVLPPLQLGGQEFLYGFPVEITNEATVPELVPQGGTA
jgi:HK97 family phage major capsid protein